jgi:hypothetical protein
MEETSLSTESSQWRTKNTGSWCALWALIGLGAAYLLVQKAEKKDSHCTWARGRASNWACSCWVSAPNFAVQ